MTKNKIKRPNLRIILEVRHPAHVHHFKYFIKEMENRGHIIKVLAIEKEVTTYLLDKYRINFVKIGKNRKGLLKKSKEMVRTDWKVLDIAKKFKPNIFVGRASPSLAHASFFIRKPYISFSDTENAKLIWTLTKPFVSNVLTSYSFTKDLGRNHIRYSGYHELGYLHPKYFKPDPSILKLLNIDKDEKYIIMRFVGWNATHDRGHRGIIHKYKLKAVKNFSKYAKIFISSEEKLTEDLKKYQLRIPPDKMHDVLYFATLLYSEGATMASECAVLGTPAIFINDNRLGYTYEEENRYGLVFNFTESLLDQEKSIKKGIELLQASNLKQEWQIRRYKMLSEKIDVTAFMVWFVENYPESARIMENNPYYQYRFKTFQEKKSHLENE